MTIWIARQSLRSYATGVLLLLSTTAHADGGIAKIDICSGLSQVAKQIMAARQQNMPMSEVLPEAIDGFRNWAEKYGLDLDVDFPEKAASEFVMIAYDELIPLDDRHKSGKVTDFENIVFKRCYEG